MLTGALPTASKGLPLGIDGGREDDNFQPGRIRQLFLELRGKCVSEVYMDTAIRLSHITESIFCDDRFFSCIRESR